MTLKEVNVEELYKNEEFYAAINAVTSPDEVKAVLAANGVEATDAEAREIYDGIVQPIGELDEEMLDNVAGGGVGEVLAALITAGGAIAVSSGVLIVGGVCFVGAAAITAYNTYKRLKNKK